MTMNAFLADLYKTAENIGGAQPSDDTEKLAQAAVLDQVFKNDGLNIANVDDATILKVASAIFGPDNEVAKVAKDAHTSAAAEEESDEEKVAQADYLGRVMAHSYVQELSNIEKEAGLKEMAGKVGGAAKHLGGKLKNLGGHAKDLGGAVAGKAKDVAGKAKDVAGKAGAHVKSHKEGYMAGAGGLTGGLAAGEAHGRSKHASAVDLLAQQKVAAILEANGVNSDATAEEKLAAAVDTRTQQLLAELGYTLSE